MLVADAVWLVNLMGLACWVEPITKGVMSTGGMVGGPEMLVVGTRHWALIVVPCGMDAMRASDSPRKGSEVVAGMCIQRPGSKWIGTGVPSAFPVATLVTSLIVCTYGTPLRKMSFCFSRPRLGTFPRDGENVSVSVVKLSSRTFSLGGVGAGGEMGLGKVVVVGGPLLGRKIRLKPVPAKVPLKFDKTPKGGEAGGDSWGLVLDPGVKFSSADCI